MINSQAAMQALDHMKEMSPIEAPFYLDPNGTAVVELFWSMPEVEKGTVGRSVSRKNCAARVGTQGPDLYRSSVDDDLERLRSQQRKIHER